MSDQCLIVCTGHNKKKKCLFLCPCCLGTLSLNENVSPKVSCVFLDPKRENKSCNIHFSFYSSKGPAYLCIVVSCGSAAHTYQCSLVPFIFNSYPMHKHTFELDAVMCVAVHVVLQKIVQVKFSVY